MGFFDHLQKKGTGAIQAQKPQIRKVEHKQSLVKSATQQPHLSRSVSSPALNGSAISSARSGSVSTFANGRSSQHRTARRNDVGGGGGGLKPTPRSKSVVRKRPSAVPRLCSSSDESDTDTSSFDLRLNKRVKVSASAEPDLKRRVRLEEAFSAPGADGDDEDGTVDMVHAANITEVKKASEFTSAFNEDKEPEVVSLQYPSVSQKEKYQLVVPREKDGFRPLDDIVQVIEMIADNYIPEEHQSIFNDDQTGLKRSLRRALTQGSFPDFQAAIEKYNGIISKLRDDGVLAKHLDSMHSLSLPLIERVLTQVYSRTVSPRVDSLRQYENGTDYVYGELLPRFVTDIFKKTGLKSDEVFVDLGSGVGNVVLQSALEIGCESWGCEIMQNASELADLQHDEFKARCRLWGLAAGDVHLVKGDFLEEERMAKVLRRADVVLINNQAFTPETNDRLINHFLDMKEGCRIVSLKSFVPAGHKIQARNLNSPINLLSVAEHNYWSDCVSWTNAGGSYFIAKKDSSKLRAFSKILH